jgi:hypothetical protein
MGEREEAYDRFYEWFSGLSEPERTRLEEENPEPDGWRGLYAMIRAHPWSD